MAKIAPGGSGSSLVGGGAFSSHPLCCYDFPLEFHVSATNTVTEAIAADPNRVYLAFINGSATQLISVSFKQSFSVTQGYQVPEVSFPLEFNRENHGPLVTLAWNCIAGGIGIPLTVISVSTHCHVEERQCGKLKASSLYEGRQRSVPLNPDHGFITSLGKPTSNWAASISSGLQPLLDSIRWQSSGSGSRIHGRTWKQRPRFRRDFRVSD